MGGSCSFAVVDVVSGFGLFPQGNTLALFSTFPGLGCCLPHHAIPLELGPAWSPPCSVGCNVAATKMPSSVSFSVIEAFCALCVTEHENDRAEKGLMCLRVSGDKLPLTAVPERTRGTIALCAAQIREVGVLRGRPRCPRTPPQLAQRSGSLEKCVWIWDPKSMGFMKGNSRQQRKPGGLQSHWALVPI